MRVLRTLSGLRRGLVPVGAILAVAVALGPGSGSLQAQCTLTCPANITVSANGTCTAVITYAAPVPNDPVLCGVITCAPASGTVFVLGVTTVSCTSAIGGGACTFTATVNDTTPPTITCAANSTQSNDPNQCGAINNFAAPTVSDNCPALGSPTCAPVSGSFFPVGTTTVTCSVTDGSGNSAACLRTTTVNDTQPPSITCPANITQSNDLNQCGAVVIYPAPTTSDNCPGVTAACVPPSGSFYPVGTTTNTCTSTDASANTATCSFTTRVNDTQPPAITCPANITRPNDPNVCSAVVAYAPTATDNCPGVTAACVPPGGSTFGRGPTTVNCTATDAATNTATCGFNVTVLTRHTVHGHFSTADHPHLPSVSQEHHGQHGHVALGQACPPHGFGHRAALIPDAGEGLFSTEALLAEELDFVAAVGPEGVLGVARRGDVLELFGSANGFYVMGDEEIAALEFTPPANSEKLYRSTRTPEVRVGGQRARVLFSGLAAGLTGVWQIRFLVPEDVPAALDVPIRVRYNEQNLTSVSVAVQ